MKVGDLVLCPVNLQTGEILADTKTLAVVTKIYDNEPKIGVVYSNGSSYTGGINIWYTSEIELVSKG